MSQFFDALERQLVALARETPRMSPCVRARRRVSVGTVTVLCLTACMAGTSLLPRIDGSPTAGIRPKVLALTGVRSRSRQEGMISVSEDPASCGRSVPVQGSIAKLQASMPDVEEGQGRPGGLVCEGPRQLREVDLQAAAMSGRTGDRLVESLRRLANHPGLRTGGPAQVRAP